MSDDIITPELVLRGYAQGIFPMAETATSPDIFWLDPKRRGILPLDKFHVSRSLAKRMRSLPHKFAFNLDFTGVVRACADREETWINPTLFDLYHQLNAMGFAHSAEVWVNGKLYGGVLGITLNGAFFGETMFSNGVDGSKIALAHLTDHLTAKGFTLFDTQFLTDHLARLGGIEISRAEYRGMLERALRVQTEI